jgi:acyl carrier protein
MILDDIKQIVAKQLDIDASTIKAETTFYDLEADSLDVVEVIMAVEDQFGVSLPDESVEALHNLGDLAALVEERKNA